VCTERIDYVDYKNSAFLRRFMSDRGKIKSRANTGTCVQHQHEVAIAIKNAREVALLPYAVRTMAADKGGGRRSRGSGPGRTGDRPTQGRPPRPGTGETPASSDSDSVLAEGVADVADIEVADVPSASSGNGVGDVAEVEAVD
jgi:small subunit ribosomal protein S18